MPSCPSHTVARPPHFLPLLLAALAIVGCGTERDDAADAGTPAADDTLGPPGAQRPDQADAPRQQADPRRPDVRTDTIRIEGMPEPMPLRLFRTPDDFPLPFSAYVPDDMAASADVPGDASGPADAHFVAEFGGVRNEDAFVHVYVFGAGTPLQEAVAHARAYEAHGGIPVSRGIDAVSATPPPTPEWATEAFRFRYQGAGGWFIGMVGVGTHDDRHFMLVRHLPAEYGDGFGPRADLILETWRWADGDGL